MKYNSKTN